MSSFFYILPKDREPVFFVPFLFHLDCVLEATADELFVHNIALMGVREHAGQMRMEPVHVMHNLVRYGNFNDLFRDANITKDAVERYLCSSPGLLDMAEFILPLPLPEDVDVLLFDILEKELPHLIKAKLQPLLVPHLQLFLN